MKPVKQVQLHNNDVFRLRVYKKETWIRGWYVEFKIGQHQWNWYPWRKTRERQLAGRS